MRATCPPRNIWRSAQVMKLLVMQSSLASCLLPLPPSAVQIFSSAPPSQTPTMYILSFVLQTKFHTHTKQQVLYY